MTRLDMGLASTLWGKQEAEPGTPLPVTCPVYASLVANHYKCVEDLDGANINELVKLAKITSRDAQAVFTFLGLTIPPDDDLVPAPTTHIF